MITVELLDEVFPVKVPKPIVELIARRANRAPYEYAHARGWKIGVRKLIEDDELSVIHVETEWKRILALVASYASHGHNELQYLYHLPMHMVEDVEEHLEMFKALLERSGFYVEIAYPKDSIVTTRFYDPTFPERTSHRGHLRTPYEFLICW